MPCPFPPSPPPAPLFRRLLPCVPPRAPLPPPTFPGKSWGPCCVSSAARALLNGRLRSRSPMLSCFLDFGPVFLNVCCLYTSLPSATSICHTSCEVVPYHLLLIVTISSRENMSQPAATINVAARTFTCAQVSVRPGSASASAYTDAHTHTHTHTHQHLQDFFAHPDSFAQPAKSFLARNGNRAGAAAMRANA